MRLINLKNGLRISLFCAALILLLSLNAAMKNAFEFDPDEGTYLVIAKLSLQGFKLYTQIWNDQPPLFTELLSAWFRVFGASVYSGRFLNFIFSFLLVWGFSRTLKIREGGAAALAATVFLVLSQEFARLSISIMPGLPSLAFAALSLYCAVVYSRSKSKPLFFCSAAFMALALATKFSALILAPAILLEISRTEKTDSGPAASLKTFFILSLYWLLSCGIIYFSFLFPYFYRHLNLFIEQLFSPHLAKLNVPGADFREILIRIGLDWDLALLATAAILTNLRPAARKIILAPALWLGTAITCFAVHRPIWYHYYLLVSIPLCWLAGIALKQLLERRKAQKRRTFLYYLIFALVALAITRLPFKFIESCLILRSPAGNERNILSLLSDFKKESRWMFTDLSIFSFLSDIPAPPETGVLTHKHPPTMELAAGILAKYRPGLILLGRFADYDPQMISLIQRDYSKKAEIVLRRSTYQAPYCWQPISMFLHPRIQYPVEKWSRGLIWRTKILSVLLPGEPSAQKAILFVRKENLPADKQREPGAVNENYF